MDLPIRIREWRKTRGLSRQAIADALGVSAVAVGHWERGANAPNQDHLHAIVALFGLTLAEFYGPLPERAAEEPATSKATDEHVA
jgi:transcriptional regulator with XRE-family HTH domain